MIAPKQIGWSEKANLLWEISRQLDRINSVVCTGPCPTSTSTTTITPTTTTTSSSSTTTTTTTALPGVLIGTQRWSTTNLDVTTYRDGTPIPQVTDPTAWAALTTGAWCYFNNDTANGAIYGKLYNWYAVNNTVNGGLAPVGQHIPTDTEFTTLITFLGGATVAGGKMKSTGTLQAGTGLWYNPNTGATNESGFTALPGCFRTFVGGFTNPNYDGIWWSSSESNTTNAWYIDMYYFDDNADRGNVNKKYGFSVRCLID
jgi:uncharacterized protein (TIGR02145 family)